MGAPLGVCHLAVECITMEVCDDNIAAARCGVGGGVVRRSGVVHVCGGGDHVFVAMFEGFAIHGCSVHV